MKIDTLTKILLGVIALCLVVLTVGVLFRTTTSEAQPKIDLSTIQLVNSSGGFLVLDKTTGDIWMYAFGRQEPDFIGRLTEPGSPLAPQKSGRR